MTSLSSATENLRGDQQPVLEAPRWSCALGGALTTGLGIYGVVPILHSGAGCGLGHQFGMTYASGENAGGALGGTGRDKATSRRPANRRAAATRS